MRAYRQGMADPHSIVARHVVGCRKEDVMSLDLHVEQKTGYVHCTFTGGIDLDSMKEAFRRTVEICGVRNQSKVLLDLRNTTGTLSVMERYDVGTFGAELLTRYAVEHQRVLQSALLGSEELVDPGRFGETVAVNRGAMAKVTTDMREALVWLDVDPIGG